MKNFCVALLVSFLLLGCLGKPKAPQETVAAQITSGLDAKLFMAITKNDVTAVKSAIVSSANVNALHQGLFSAGCLDNASPLYFAVFNENATLVEFLLANGADPSIPNRYNELPIEHAERRGFSEIAILLEKYHSFPNLPTIDQTVYKNIKKTCLKRWDMKKMKMGTFKIVPCKTVDEYAVHCDGFAADDLYCYVIRVDAKGNWINDRRSKKNP